MSESYRERITAILNEHPEWGAYGKVTPLYGLVDCAPSTVRHYVSLWRRNGGSEKTCEAIATAPTATRGRVPWAQGAASDDSRDVLVVYPPLESKACKRCKRREECRAHDRATGHILCEPLSYWDLWAAERDGVLDATVWWQKLPQSYTADDVVRVMGNRNGNGHGRGNGE
jgi:hypothetical protein